jgi:putative DNA primase/helicase
LFVLYGGGDNGKTTLLETIRALTGEYAGIVEIDVLMQNSRDDARERTVAQLVGIRFVTSSEAEEGQRMKEAKVKNLTGMGTLQGRHIYGSPFEFYPQFKLFIDANYKPVIRGTDNAIWNRVHLIPFRVSIPKEQQDRDLGNKLKAELPGILASAVKGCLTWQQEGLRTPKAITDAGAQYREEMDLVAEFISDCCDVDPEATELSADLHLAFKRWCEDRGEEPFTETKFGIRLTEKDFAGVKVHGQRARKGLRLLKWREDGSLESTAESVFADG